jgi:hypothetical protein
LNGERTQQPAVKALRCVGCASTTTDGFGWRAFLTFDDEVAVYCPECAAWEFGVP